MNEIYDADEMLMSDEEIREMLRVNLLAEWPNPYLDVSVTIHEDGGATMHLELTEDQVQGLAETW